MAALVRREQRTCPGTAGSGRGGRGGARPDRIEGEDGGSSLGGHGVFLVKGRERVEIARGAREEKKRRRAGKQRRRRMATLSVPRRGCSSGWVLVLSGAEVQRGEARRRPAWLGAVDASMAAFALIPS